MKIPVHEIDGDYYCAIDDITIAVSKATGNPRTRESCLSDLLTEGFDAFVDYHHSRGEGIIIGEGENGKKYSEPPKGFYRIVAWSYEGGGDFTSLRPQIKVNRVSHPHDTRGYYEIGLYYAPQMSHFYVSKQDASIYLSRCDDIDFSPPTTKKEKVAEPVEAIDDRPLSEKERGNLHRLIHAMKEALLDDADGARAFKSQNALVDHLASAYAGYSGLSKTQLKTLYAELNRQFAEAEKTFKNS